MMYVLLFLLSGLSLMGGRISAFGAFVSCIWRRGRMLKYLDVLQWEQKVDELEQGVFVFSIFFLIQDILPQGKVLGGTS